MGFLDGTDDGLAKKKFLFIMIALINRLATTRHGISFFHHRLSKRSLPHAQTFFSPSLLDKANSYNAELFLQRQAQV